MVRVEAANTDGHDKFALLEFVPGGTVRKLILKQMTTSSKLYTDADALRFAFSRM